MLLPEGAADLYRNSNLTPHQLLVWLGQKLHPESPIYNVTVAFSLLGKIDPQCFKLAFGKLVAASDALSTVIEEIDGVPLQRAISIDNYALNYTDLSALSDPERACADTMRARNAAPLDLSRQLFDAALYKIGADRYVWYLNQHHIITDGVSVSLIYNHTAEFYRRACEGTLYSAPPLPRFYDYVDDELKHQSSSRRTEAEAYWRRKLADGVDTIDVYGPRLRHGTRVERVSMDLGSDRSAKLKSVAAQSAIARRSANLGTFLVVAAALSAYLYRATGKNRLSIGIPFHNRGSTPFRDVIGLIMKVIPIQITVNGDDSFVSVIDKIHCDMSEFRPYRDIALANTPGARIYDVWLNYITATYPPFCDIASVRNRWLHSGHGRDALALQVHDFTGTGQFTLEIDFHCDVFDDEERREVVRHFLKVFDALLENPAARIDSVMLLDEAERRRIVEDRNLSTWRPHGPQALSRLFEAAAEKNARAAALLFEDREITYETLNAEANRLARHLRARGAGPEKVVALCAEPSPELIVGMLAILKAGAAYLPLDPEYPVERLDFMLKDAGAALLLTEARLVGAYPHLADLNFPAVVYVDAERDKIASRPATNLDDGPGPKNLAYVIYTSGTSGTPKGVMIEHAAICNRLHWGAEHYGLNASDRVLQKASLAFDASVWEIFEPLIASAAVVMARPHGRLDVEYLGELMARQKVTVAEFSPSLLRVLVGENKLAACGALKRVFSGGEALTADLQNAFFAQSRAELYNTYGPTEASVDVTHWQCRRDAAATDNIPIGRPIAGMRIYILDRGLEPRPAGMPGELCIGGIGVARGYVNAPALTAEKFVPDPFSREPGARLYKTGDVARHRRDGTIEFLGRIDDQVKVRGFRVEPGEIAAALLTHPALKSAVVTAEADGAAGNRLTAYVVAAKDEPPEQQEIRRYLRQRLPNYMIPNHFVFVDSLPLTPSGKLDRRALPSPLANGRADRPVRELLEARLAEIWEDLLRVHPIGAEDNFFHLGGDSLLVVHLMHRIEHAFGERIPLSSFLAAPTLKGLAAALVKQRTETDRSLMVAVQAGSDKAPFFYLHGNILHGGFYCVNLARYVGDDRPFYALAPHGLNGTAIPPTIEAMAASFIEMIRTVQPRGPYFIGGICNGGVIAYEMARQLETRGERVGLVVVIAARARLEGHRRALRAFIDRIGNSFALSPDQRTEVFLQLRGLGHRLREIYRSLRRGGLSYRAERRKVAVGTEAFRLKLFDALGRALGGYIPKPYAGRILVLSPNDEPDLHNDPSAGWGRVAPQSKFQVVPGGHITCVTDHLKTLAEHIRSALEAAEQALREDRTGGEDRDGPAQ